MCNVYYYYYYSLYTTYKLWICVCVSVHRQSSNNCTTVSKINKLTNTLLYTYCWSCFCYSDRYITMILLYVATTSSLMNSWIYIITKIMYSIEQINNVQRLWRIIGNNILITNNVTFSVRTFWKILSSLSFYQLYLLCSDVNVAYYLMFLLITLHGQIGNKQDEEHENTIPI